MESILNTFGSTKKSEYATAPLHWWSSSGAEKSNIVSLARSDSGTAVLYKLVENTGGLSFRSRMVITTVAEAESPGESRAVTDSCTDVSVS